MDLQKLIQSANSKVQNLVQSFKIPQVNHNPINSIGQSVPNIPQAQPIQFKPIVQNTFQQVKPILNRTMNTQVPVSRLLSQTQFLNALPQPSFSPEQFIQKIGDISVPLTGGEGFKMLSRGDIQGYKNYLTRPYDINQVVNNSTQMAMGSINPSSSQGLKFRNALLESGKIKNIAKQEAENLKYVKELKDAAEIKKLFKEGVDVANPTNTPFTFKVKDPIAKLKEEGRKAIYAVDKIVKDQTGAVRLDLGLTGGGEKLTSKVRQGESSKNIIPQDVKAGLYDADKVKQFLKSSNYDKLSQQEQNKLNNLVYSLRNFNGNVENILNPSEKKFIDQLRRNYPEFDNRPQILRNETINPVNNNLVWKGVKTGRSTEPSGLPQSSTRSIIITNGLPDGGIDTSINLSLKHEPIITQVDKELGKAIFAGKPEALKLSKDEFVSKGLAYYKTTPEYKNAPAGDKGWYELTTKNDLERYYREVNPRLPQQPTSTAGLYDTKKGSLFKEAGTYVSTKELKMSPKKQIDLVASGKKPAYAEDYITIADARNNLKYAKDKGLLVGYDKYKRAYVAKTQEALNRVIASGNKGAGIGVKLNPTVEREHGLALGFRDIRVAQQPIADTKIATQKSIQEARKLAPSERTAQQLQESRQSVQELNNAGNISGGGGKPPSSSVVQDLSKYNYNINTNKLKMNKGQKQTFGSVVEAIKPQLEKVKGKTLSNDEVKQAAKQSEMLTQVTSREQTLQAEASILKARQRMVELNNNIDRLAREGKTEEMRTQLRDLIDTTKVISANAADAGRRLQSLSIDATDEGIRTALLKDISKTGASTEDILKAAEQVDWNNAKSITQFYRKFVKPSYMEVLDEFRYNNMLSNPLTHVRNAYSNTLQTFVVRPATLLVEGKPVQAAKYFSGAMKSFPEAMTAFSKAFKEETVLAKPDIERIGTGKLPSFLTVPTRAMEAGDKFFTALIQGGERARGATAEQAAATAEYSLFRQGLNPKGQGSVLNAIDGLTNWTYKAPKAVRWFVPFIRTPMNFAKQWLEYSPAGFATAYKAGAPKEQIAKAILGSTVTAFGGMLAMQGRTTWAAPTDPKQKDLFYASGRKPFSILIGDKWVPMQYAGPFALALALPAAAKYYQEDNRTAPTDSQLDVATKTVFSMAQFFSQQTFLTGLGNFVNWASGSQDVSLASSLGFTAQQVIPMEGLVSYINTILDPVYRKSNSFTGSIQKNIPGLSQQLEPYTNPDGTPSTRLPVNYALPYGVGQRNQQYEPALEARTAQLQTNAIKNQLKREAQAGGGGIYGDKMIGSDGSEIDLNPPTTGQGIDAFVNKDWNVKKALSIWAKKDKFTQDQVNEAFKKLGVDYQDVRYAYLASKSTDISVQYIDSKSDTHEKLLKNLLTGRVVGIGGVQFANNSVVDQFYNQGKITKEERDALKNIKIDKKGNSLNKNVSKGKKVKLPTLKAAQITLKKNSVKNVKIQQAPKLKIPNVNFNSQFSNTSTNVPLPNFKVKFNV